MAGKTSGLDCQETRCSDSEGTDAEPPVPGTVVSNSIAIDSTSEHTLPDNGRRISSAQIRKRKQQQEELVNSLITEAEASGAISLDLNKKGLKKIPAELLQLTQLEYLYLEGNDLKCLPENFFDCLANLKWLDLRNNYLTAMPSTYIGRHENLRNLLLEGNQLRTLPLELGLVTTLNGLNIAKNPLEFPPEDIINSGTPIVLAFFRHMLEAKSQGRIPSVPRIEDLQLRDSDDSGDERGSSSSSGKFRRNHGSGYRSNQNSAYHRHQMLLQSRQPSKSGKQKKSRSGYNKLGTLGRYPEPPPPDRVDELYMEERRLAKLRSLQDKQEMLLQKRRDQDLLRDWRTDGKRLQKEKDMQRRIHGHIEFDEPAKQAPFAVANEHMRVPSNTERIAQDVKDKHEKIRRALSPNTMYQLEEARANRDRELEKRIKMHTLSMNERRKKPQGTPQEDMIAAKRELQIAEQLQQEIEARRKQLEYRFTAFTGDAAPY